MSSRRDVLRMAALASASALVPGAPGAAAASLAAGTPDPLTREFYGERLGSRFDARAEDGTSRPLRLVDVADPAFATASRRGLSGCFRAVFEGDAALPLSQGTITMTGRGAPAFALFLVPTGSSRDGVIRYEAAFNRTRA
jgi:hypothetical protein